MIHQFKALKMCDFNIKKNERYRVRNYFELFLLLVFKIENFLNVVENGDIKMLIKIKLIVFSYIKLLTDVFY